MKNSLRFKGVLIQYFFRFSLRALNFYLSVKTKLIGPGTLFISNCNQKRPFMLFHIILHTSKFKETNEFERSLRSY